MKTRLPPTHFFSGLILISALLVIFNQHQSAKSGLPRSIGEICDNGIDDDSDGLVDLNDTVDCLCDLSLPPQNFIPNSSFELPNYFLDINSPYKLDHWYHSIAPGNNCKAQIFHDICYPLNGITKTDLIWSIPRASEPWPNGRQYVIAQANSSGSLVMANCLSGYIEAGNNYELSFYMQKSNQRPVAQPHLDSMHLRLRILGKDTCLNIDQDLQHQGYCTNGSEYIRSTWDTLSMDTITINESNWQKFTLKIQPVRDVAAIQFAFQGADPYSLGISYFLDEMRIIPLDDTSTLRIRSSDSCYTHIYTLDNPDNLPLQWYKDGIALVNENSNQLDAGQYGSGYFEATVSENGNCLRVEGKDYAHYNPDLTIEYVRDLLFCDSFLCFIAVNNDPDTASCQGDSIWWSDWSKPEVHDEHTQRGFDKPGQYYMLIHDHCGWRIGIDTFYINICDDPVLSLDSILCDGDTIILDAELEGAWSYIWLGPGVYSEYSPTLVVTEPGTYTSYAQLSSLGFNLVACGTTRTIEIKEELSDLSLGNDTVLCNGAHTILFTGIQEATYIWQDGSTDSLYRVSSPGNYHVTVTSGNCAKSADINVDYFDQELNLGIDTLICTGQPYLIQSDILGSEYLWHDGSINSTFNATLTGLHWLEVRLGSCSVRDSIFIQFIDLSQLDLGRDTILCGGDSIELMANIPNAQYHWQNGSQTQSVLALESGLYVVTVSVNACSRIDSIQIDITSIDFDFGNDLFLCSGTNYTLDAAIADASYLWQDGSIQSSINTDQSGLYWVEITLNSCQIRDSIYLSFNEEIVVDLGNDTTLCDGDTLMLSVVASDGTHLWQDGSSEPSLSVIQPGMYWVEISQGNCVGVDSIFVAFSSLPSRLLPDEMFLCSDQYLDLSVAQPDATYSWQDGSSEGVLRIFNSGVYWVDITIGNCMISDSVIVHDIANEINFLGNDTVLCTESHPLGLIIPDASYLWHDNSTSSSFLASSSGNYAVTVTTTQCQFFDSINLEFLQPPEIDLGPDRVFCQGDSFYVELPIAYQYNWQDGSNFNTFIITAPGLYWVEAINSEMCVSSDTLLITYQICDHCSIYIPTAFSPNKDYVNDVYQAYGKSQCIYDEYEMKIYNRWGGLVFQGIDINDNWDGQHKESDVNQGTYIVIISYINESGNRVVRYGDFLLLR